MGVDLSPRAVCFARFNALLNGIDNCSFVVGDLYGPVAGQRFERVLANPPFVACPELGTLLFRDGGRSGEEVLGRLVAGCEEHLTRGGTVVIRTDLVEHAGERYHDKLRQWLGGGAGFQAITLEASRIDPFTYAAYHNDHLSGDGAAWQDEVFRWIDSYLDEGVVAMRAGFIVLGRRGSGPFLGQALPVGDSFGRHSSLERLADDLLRRQERLAELDRDNTRLELACEPGLVELHPSDGGWPDAAHLGYGLVRLVRLLEEAHAEGLTAAALLEVLKRDRPEGEPEAAREPCDTFAELFVAGYVRPRPAV